LIQNHGVVSASQLLYRGAGVAAKQMPLRSSSDGAALPRKLPDESVTAA
jgi:hypothetical protein